MWGKIYGQQITLNNIGSSLFYGTSKMLSILLNIHDAISFQRIEKGCELK